MIRIRSKMAGVLESFPLPDAVNFIQFLIGNILLVILEANRTRKFRLSRQIGIRL